MNPFGLIRSYTAGGAIARNRIVAWSATEGRVVQASAVTDKLMGASGVVGVTAAGDRLDIHRSEFAKVAFGGAVSQGDPLTTDADGKAVAAAPATGVNVHCLGWAEVDAVAGDIGEVFIHPFILQGA
ncbi:DUF2190 domain-containing protein [Rhodospirillum sp. A1_3_36]|uniref:DUF2190 domain-containing protein n=1 Tax=Rhodospirillum sp. A1_3_36 TaxID=3391666 RepID=UPI0039A512C8